MDVYEVICKIVHLKVRTLSYVNRPTSGPLRPPSRSAELRTMPEVGRKCLESAHFRLTSGPALLRFTSVHLRPTSAHFCAIPRAWLEAKKSKFCSDMQFSLSHPPHSAGRAGGPELRTLLRKAVCARSALAARSNASTISARLI